MQTPCSRKLIAMQRPTSLKLPDLAESSSAVSPRPANTTTDAMLSDSASQWPIREGTDSPPRWGHDSHVAVESPAKRKRETRMESNGSSKKSKLEAARYCFGSFQHNRVVEIHVIVQ